MQYHIILCLFTVKSLGIQATTVNHWLVTETGLIKPKVDSPFQMKNSHDLIAFLNQDTRWNNIINLYHDLVNRQSILDKQWALIEKVDYFKTNKQCEKAGTLNILNWYGGELDDGGSKDISKEEYLLTATFLPSYNDKDYIVPDCKKISPVIDGMFDHLNGTSGKVKLTLDTEKRLPLRVALVASIDQYGHWLAKVLRKNSSSWLHYNLASIYWRVKGSADKAMECSRRAVHYAPQYYIDIALVNMGVILHQSKMTEDAIKVLSAAIDHESKYYYSHFILANALAVFGDFDNSLKHYDQCLRLRPDFKKAEMHKEEMLCIASKIKDIRKARDTTTEFRKNLKEYLQREAYWVKSQGAFLMTMQHEMEHDFRIIDKNCEKMTELTGLNIKGLKGESEKYALIYYYLESPMYNNDWMNENGVHTMSSARSLYVLVTHILNNAHNDPEIRMHDKENFKITDGTISEEIGPMPLFNIDHVVESSPPIEMPRIEVPTQIEKEVNTVMSEFETGILLYSQSMKVNRNNEDFDKDPDWPSVKFCKDYSSVNLDKVEGIYPVFLPFENKGVRLGTILSDKIGIPLTKEHSLPWHPPYCTDSKESVFPQKKNSKNPMLKDIIATDYLNRKLLEYVSDGDPESVKHLQKPEIGQRIYSAMEQDVAPKWILYTLSSLYWRVRGNNNNALSCLLTALKVVNNPYKDLVLASIASIYVEMGYFDESLGAAEDAFKLNMYEPATNFIIAELNMIKKHRNTQLFHLKQVVRVDPDFMDGLGRTLLNSWACINDFTRHANVMKEMAFIAKDECSEDKELNACNNDGVAGNCKSTNFKCVSSRKNGMTSMVKKIEQSSVDDDLVDVEIFSFILKNMPTQRSAMIHHEMNYHDLMRIEEFLMMGCGKQGCSSMTAEELALKHSDCVMQYMQLRYWLEIVGFRQILQDPNLRLPSELEIVKPSDAKKVPECRLIADTSTDYFLNRMMHVDTEGWEPDLSLMYQYTEIYEYSDYVTHGAKLAKYLNERPQSWRVLLTAGWWCGVGGRGACALRCLAAAFSLAPKHLAVYAPLSLSALLNMQSKLKDAKDMAYLAFYMAPSSKLGGLIAAISHSYLNEYDQAVWMFRYTMQLDAQYLPAKACLLATMCHMLYPELIKDEL